MKACFMGLGYIGLPTAIIAAKHGVQVTGVDINKNVVEQTNAGHLHIIEPGLEALLKEVACYYTAREERCVLYCCAYTVPWRQPRT